MHPFTLWFASKGAPLFTGPTLSGYSWSCQVPRAPLHDRGVTSLIVVSKPRQQVLPCVIAPTDINTMWQPWLLRPSLSRFVTSPCPGYANRPNRAIDGMGTFTPSDTQPCRLLPERQPSAAADSRSEEGADAGGSQVPGKGT